MNCHGHDTRVRIVENYNIRCTAHIRLLNGQVIRSDAERDITDTYYIFECVNKNDDNDVDRIVCGTGAARDLLQLANITAPPIFNMLHEVGGAGGAGRGNRRPSPPPARWPGWQSASLPIPCPAIPAR